MTRPDAPVKTAREEAEHLYRTLVSDHRCSRGAWRKLVNCDGECGAIAIADAIAAAEARGFARGVETAAGIVSDLSTNEHQVGDMKAFYALNRAWHALNALAATPGGADPNCPAHGGRYTGTRCTCAATPGGAGGGK